MFIFDARASLLLTLVPNWSHGWWGWWCFRVSSVFDCSSPFLLS